MQLSPERPFVRRIGSFTAFPILILIPLLVVWLFASCSPTQSMSSPAQPAESTTLTIGFPYPSGQDALHGVAQAARLASLEGLTTQDINGRPVPRLAQSWSQSDDGLTWTIKLRPTAQFHDGSPVDAEAVKSSLERFLGANKGRLGPGLQPISSIAASGTHDVIIHLSERSSLLVDDLETPITKVDGKGAVIGTWTVCC